jgi:alpha-mannosidase
MAIVCTLALANAPIAAALESDVIWSLGEPNGLSIEFAPGSRDHLSFTVGTNVASRDFAGNHGGSLGFDGKQAEKPYTITFDLDQAPQGNYTLELDLIFRSGAPGQLKIKLNEQLGIFPLRPMAKKSSDGEEGNAMLLAKQSVHVPIEATRLKPKGNQITLVPLGIGSFSYDAVTLRRAAPTKNESLRLEPTIYFRKNGSKLMEVCDLIAPFQKRFDKAVATVRLGNRSFSKSFTNAVYDFGVWRESIEIPASLCAGQATVELDRDGQSQQVSQDLKPAKQWKVFICPKVHNDVGYTDLQPHVNELDNRNTDTVLDILARYPFYKFNFETSWLVENYLDCRTSKYREQFFKYAGQKRATINAFYLNLMTGVCSGEELYRAMYLTHRLHRERGSNFDFACLTDAPSHSWFLPTLLSDAGIKAFSNGSNQSRAPILHHSELNEDSPFYWEGMNGERILMWYARSYVQLKRLTGPDWSGETSNLDYLKSSVPQFLCRYLRDDYATDAVMIYGAYVDNAAVPHTAEAPVIEQWNKEFEFPKLIVASDGDYFNYIAKNFTGDLPVYRGDCGAYWEDGVASSAQATALNRRTQQLLPIAETSAALASLFEPRNRYPAEDFADAWKNVMFYDEHTWGAHNSIAQPDRQFVTRQWEIKESYATRANLDARNLLARGNNRLCQQIAVDGSAIIAFNWQNWPRSAPLEVEIDSGQQLVDLASNKPVPMDVIEDKDGYRKVRFLAQDVPPMGYRGYAIRGLNAAAHKTNEPISGPTIENEFYRLTVDTETAGLKSLFDKTANRELLDSAAPYKLNEYLYVSGGEGSLILNHTFGSAPAQLTIHRPEKAEIVERVKTPLGQRIVVVTKGMNTPKIRSEYLLYDKLKRVDIVNTIEKLETRAKEAVYFAFPFAARQPGIEYQIQNGWVRPNEDQLPGACREWFTPQNLVHVRDGNFSVAWSTADAPLATFTDINRGKWLSHLPIRNGHVYSYIMNNYWFTNYRAQQGGTFIFHYSITSGTDLGREQLARFDADTRSPVSVYPFLSTFSMNIAQADRPFPASSASFLTLEAANLQMVTFKAAEDQDGYILRLRETAGRTGEAKIKFPALRVQAAQLCNGVEENQQKLAVANNGVTVPFKPNQFITVRLKLEWAAQRVARK